GVDQIRQLRLVELLEHIGLDLPLQEIGGGHDDVVTGLARQEPRLQRLIGIEGVVDDLDAGLLAEILQDVGRDIVRPIVEIDRALLGAGRARQKNGRDQDRSRRKTVERLSYVAHPLTFLRRCTASDRRSSAVSSVESFLAKQKRTTE